MNSIRTTPPSPASGRGVGGEGVEPNYTPQPPSKLPKELLQHVRLLRNRNLAGAKFKRQHPVGKYITDFHCDDHQLVIELDGGQHAEQQHYDEQRTAYLQSQGLTVMRFWNHQVLNETEAVLQVIWEHVAK